MRSHSSAGNLKQLVKLVSLFVRLWPGSVSLLGLSSCPSCHLVSLDDVSALSSRASRSRFRPIFCYLVSLGPRSSPFFDRPDMPVGMQFICMSLYDVMLRVIMPAFVSAQTASARRPSSASQVAAS